MRGQRKSNKSKKSAVSRDTKVHTSKRQTNAKSRSIVRSKDSVQVSEEKSRVVVKENEAKTGSRSRGRALTGGSKGNMDKEKHVPGLNARSHKSQSSHQREDSKEKRSARTSTEKLKKSEAGKPVSKDEDKQKKTSSVRSKQDSSRNASRDSGKKGSSSKRAVSKKSAERHPENAKTSAPVASRPSGNKQNSNSRPERPPSSKSRGTPNEKKSNRNSQINGQSSQIKESKPGNQDSKLNSKTSTAKRDAGESSLARRSKDPSRREFSLEEAASQQNRATGDQPAQKESRSIWRDPVIEPSKQMSRSSAEMKDIVNAVNHIVDEVAEREISVIRRSSSVEKYRDPTIITTDPRLESQQRINSQVSGFIDNRERHREPSSDYQGPEKTHSDQQFGGYIPPSREIPDPVIGSKTPSISDSFLIG